MNSKALKNGKEKKKSWKETEKTVSFINKEVEKSSEKVNEKEDKKGKRGKKRKCEDSSETQLSSQPREPEGILTSKRSKLPEPSTSGAQANCGSDDDDDVVETQRFSKSKLQRLDERKFRLTNKLAKFQVCTCLMIIFSIWQVNIVQHNVSNILCIFSGPCPGKAEGVHPKKVWQYWTVANTKFYSVC